MNTDAIARELLRALGRELNLPELCFDPNGCANLVFTGKSAIDLEIDVECDCIQAYGVIGPFPPSGSEDLCRRLLEANLFGRQTGGATLAIDASQEELLLCRRIDLATATEASFKGILEDFAGMIQHWQGQLNDGDPAGDHAAQPGQHWQQL